jgi:cell division protein FtsB
VLQAIEESMADIEEEIAEKQKELDKLEAREASLIATPQKSKITPTRN